MVRLEPARARVVVGPRRAVAGAWAVGAVLVDARTNEQFDEAHVPGALSASAYDTGFGRKVAHVIHAKVEVIVIAASDESGLEAAKLLASVGVRVRGYLEGGMTAWRSEERPVERIAMIAPGDLAERLGEGIVVLDVRDETEFALARIAGSMLIPYRSLLARLDELPRDRPIATVCSAGKRSGLAASILQREGFTQLLHVAPGGISTWERQGRPLERG